MAELRHAVFTHYQRMGLRPRPARILVRKPFSARLLLVVRKDGYAEVVRHPTVQASKTSQTNVRLRRIFIPDTEIVTARGNYRGVLVSVTPDSVVLEVSMGITRSFSKDEIRRMETLSPQK